MSERDDPPGTGAGESQREREEDLLVALMGRYLTQRPDSPLYDDERFLEWWGNELREYLRPSERARARDQARGFARDVLSRLEVASARVTYGGTWPIERTPPVEGTVSG